MKILKKLTALTMAVIMVLSLFAINASAVTIQKIEITKQPTKTTFEYGNDWKYGYWKYPEGDGLGVFTPDDRYITFMHQGGYFSMYQDRGMLDMRGLEVKVTYTNGTVKTIVYKETLNSNNVVSQNILASPAGGNYKYGENTIEIYFAENTQVYTTYKINIVGHKPGDVDGNKKINSTDALMALQSSVKLVTLSKYQQKAADMDNNGKINSLDALMILKKAVA